MLNRLLETGVQNLGFSSSGLLPSPDTNQSPGYHQEGVKFPGLLDGFLPGSRPRVGKLDDEGGERESVGKLVGLTSQTWSLPLHPNRRRCGSRKSEFRPSPIVQPWGSARCWPREWGSGLGVESPLEVRLHVLTENTCGRPASTVDSSATEIHFLVQNL